MSRTLKIAMVIMAGVGLLNIVGRAQEPRRPPQPGPEVKKLAFFIGNVASEGTMTVGSTKGKFSAKDHAEWMKGGFFVENRSDFITPFGRGSLVEIMGYDAARRVYTHDSYSSTGLHISSTGMVDGDSWTWTDAGGRSRHVIKTLSPFSFSFKTETSQDGTAWTTLVQGIATKKQ